MTETQDLETQLNLLLKQLSLEQKIELLTGESMWALGAQPSIGLRTMVASDGPAGIRGASWDERNTATALPSASALGAGWNPRLARLLGIELAREAKLKGVDIVLAPTVNLHRSPRGGRHFESFSEDPFLSGEIAAAIVEGVQSEGIAATAKHYVCNDSETDRMNVDIQVSERALREVYLAPFEKLVVDTGVRLVMSSYNSVNGTTMSENELLTSPLKDEWGFDGVVISDWAGVRSTEESAISGQDIVMPGPATIWGEALIEAVTAGRVPEAAIDEKVMRVLRLAAWVGALEGVKSEHRVTDAEPSSTAIGHLSDPETNGANLSDLSRGAKLSYLAAVDGTVLVKNDAVLGSRNAALPAPIESVASVAVIGQAAVTARSQGGGSAMVFPKECVTPYEGIRNAYGAERVKYALGVTAIHGFQTFSPTDVTVPETGEPGIRLRYLGHEDEILLEERRLSGQFMWMSDPIIDKTKTVELSMCYQAKTSGEFGFGVAGLGGFEIAFDGKVVAEERVEFDSVDPVMGMLDPPQRITRILMEAGQVLDLRIRYRVEVQELLKTFAIRCGVEEPRGNDGEELASAVKLAAESDLAVVVVGTSATEESEGFDRETLHLQGCQNELVRAVLAANPRTVVVVNSGGPVIMPWLEDAPATLLQWFPGQEGGRALADVLTGEAEPGGRMPTTWANSEDDVPIWQVDPISGTLHYGDDIHCGYREWSRRVAAGGPKPALTFGYGLGYTSWELQSATVVPAATAGACVIDVSVRNTGARAGKIVVQAYLSKPDSTVERPVHWLGAFATDVVAAGKESIVRLDFSPRAFRYWSTEQSGWVDESGEYLVNIGQHAADSAFTISVTR